MREYTKNGTKFKIWKEERELITQKFNPETGNFENKKVKTYWQEVNGVKESISERDYLDKLISIKEPEKKIETESKPKPKKKSGKKRK